MRNVPFSAYVFLLVSLTSFFSLSSCQRAPYAYFTPTHRPAHQRIAKEATTPTPAADLQITASLSDAPALPTKPVWAETSAPATEPAIATEVRRPTVWQRYKRMLPRKPTPPQCDQIVLRNGDVIDAKVKEVGVNEIRYKKCDRQDGPDYTISKRDILSIKYSNGEVERFNNANTNPSYNNNSSSSGGRSYDSPTNSRNDGPRTDPFAIVALATGALAILTGYGAFLLFAAAIVFGALSLSRIRKEPGRFKGKGLAIAGMVAGLVSAGIVLLYILF